MASVPSRFSVRAHAVCLAALAVGFFFIFDVPALKWEKRSLTTAVHQRGALYTVSTNIRGFGQQDFSDMKSPVRLYEDGKLLPMPNATAEDIINMGRGRYLMWGDTIYFSASDNTDPRTNGRRYELHIPRSWIGTARTVSYAFALIAIFFLVFWQRQTIAALSKETYRNGALWAVHRKALLGKMALVCCLLCMVPALLFVMGIVPSQWETRGVSGAAHQKGFLYTSPTNIRGLGQQDFSDMKSPVRLYEDGKLLPIPNAPAEDIINMGGGRYLMWGDTIYFSASDNTDPRTNGRRYELHIPGLWIGTARTVSYAFALIAVFFLVFWQRQTIAALSKETYRNGALWAVHRKALLGKMALVCCLLCMVPALLFVMDIVPSQWETRGVSGAAHQKGFLYTSPTNIRGLGQQDFSDMKSPVRLYEDGKLLPIPNAPAEDIINMGRGRYLMWGDTIYFSASDNTDPRTNGRRYELHIPGLWIGTARTVSYAFALIAIFFLVFWHRQTIAALSKDMYRNARISWAAHRKALLGKMALVCCLLCMVPTLLFVMDIVPSQWETRGVSGATHQKGFLYTSPTNIRGLGQQDFSDMKSPVRLYEGGKLLPMPNAPAEDIINMGRGRYLMWGDTIYFSASDNTDPRTNGRRYELHIPRLWIDTARTVSYAFALIAIFFLVFWQRQTIAVLSKEMYRNGALWAAHRKALLGKMALVCCLLCMVPALLFVMDIVPSQWETRGVSGATHQKGFLYTSPTNIWGLGQQDFSDMKSPVRLYEDGKLLPMPNALAESIINIGRGRYLMWEDTIYFSASDNTDPRTNGRRYELRYPSLHHTVLKNASYLTAAVSILISFILLGNIFFKKPLYVAIVFLLVIFSLGRLWFFKDFPLPDIQPDYSSYYSISKTIGSGDWPQFGIRPPLYPLFLKLIFLFSDRNMTAIIFQNLLSLLSGLCMVYAVYRIRYFLAVPAAFAMAGFAVGPWVIAYDTTMLSESLYVSCIVFSFAFLLLAIYGKIPAAFGLASLAMAGAILTRPAALFFLVIYLLVLVFLLWNTYSKKCILWFAVPMAALLLALCTYNFFTMKTFSITAWGEGNIAVSTFTFWEKDDAYPPEVNTHIGKVQEMIQARLTDEDRQILNSSWDPRRLRSVFSKGFYFAALVYASTKLGAVNSDLHALSSQDGRKWLRVISTSSIRKHPDLYLKFVVSNLIQYFFINIRELCSPEQLIQERASKMYIDKTFSADKGNLLMTEMGKEYADPPLLSSIQRDKTGTDTRFTETPALKAVNTLLRIRNGIFARAAWILIFLMLFVLSCLKLYRTRFSHVGAFMVFTLTSACIGAALIVSLSEDALVRYSYPTEFIYYLSAVLSPLLFNGKRTASVRGFAFIAQTNHEEFSSHEHPSRGEVLENGKPLPEPASAVHDDICRMGKRRYPFWQDQVYCSASDLIKRGIQFPAKNKVHSGKPVLNREDREKKIRSFMRTLLKRPAHAQKAPTVE